MREIIGRGTLFSQASLMFGELGEALQITLVPDHPGFLLAMLPPGAFIGLGLLIAARSWMDGRSRERAGRARAMQPSGITEDVVR